MKNWVSNTGDLSFWWSHRKQIVLIFKIYLKSLCPFEGKTNLNSHPVLSPQNRFLTTQVLRITFTNINQISMRTLHSNCNMFPRTFSERTKEGHDTHCLLKFPNNSWTALVSAFLCWVFKEEAHVNMTVRGSCTTGCSVHHELNQCFRNSISITEELKLIVLKLKFLDCNFTE